MASEPKQVDFPFRVFLKIAAGALFVYALLKIAPLLLWLLLAILIATTLYPIQEWLVQKRLPRILAFLLLTTVTLGVFGVFLFVLLPKVVDQFGTLPEHFAQVAKDLTGKISDESLRAELEAVVKDPTEILGNLPQKAVALSGAVMGGLFKIGLMLVMSLYLLADGKKTYRWLRAIFAISTQKKLDETADQVATIVAAYVGGQMITSGLVAIFVFVLLSMLKIPAALSISALAAIFEILPMIGFLVSLGLALLLAITVSGSTALIVATAFVAYHFLDNYVIIPRIYGNRMRLSGLVVLLSLVFAVEIGGVLAGILALPLVAAYPIIERIWLGKLLGPRTVAQHAVNEEEKSDSKSY